jgi:hypothetical protein
VAETPHTCFSWTPRSSTRASLLGIVLFEIGDGHCSNQYYEGWFNERASCFRRNASAFALPPSSPSSFDSIRRCWLR